jgi:outer membrane protein, multidrug efflux system
MKKVLKPLSVVIPLLLLSACKTAGPNYHATEVSVPAQWQSASGSQADAPLQHDWWKSFNDAQLNQLIAEAQRANLDVQIAAVRVRQARAQLSVDEAASDVTALLSGSATEALNSANSKQRSSTGAVISTGGYVYNSYKLGFDAQWEMDLFGGIARSNEAAAAGYTATVESGRMVLVSLLAEVARNYIELRANQQQFNLTQKTIATLNTSLELLRAREQAGLASGNDAARMEAQLAATQAQLNPLQSAIKKSIYRISVMLAKPPAALLAELSPVAPVPQSNAGINTGLPSDLLLRRPDIRRAERDVAKATADIGVATADLFPRFSLAAMVGLQSSDANNLISGNSKTWSLVPGFKLPIFGRDKIRENISIRNAQQEQALLSYQSTVLAALEDVENALVVYHNEQQRRLDLAHAYAANQRAHSLAQRRFDSGLTSLIDVLDSERALLATQTQLLQADASGAASMVALYKALGGGWE